MYSKCMNVKSMAPPPNVKSMSLPPHTHAHQNSPFLSSPSQPLPLPTTPSRGGCAMAGGPAPATSARVAKRPSLECTARAVRPPPREPAPASSVSPTWCVPSVPWDRPTILSAPLVPPYSSSIPQTSVASKVGWRLLILFLYFAAKGRCFFGHMPLKSCPNCRVSMHSRGFFIHCLPGMSLHLFPHTCVHKHLHVCSTYTYTTHAHTHTHMCTPHMHTHV